LRLHPVNCGDELFAEIVKTAVRFARTSGMMRAVSPRDLEQQPAARRSPSTMPPRPALV
jgi:hypothetical protein